MTLRKFLQPGISAVFFLALILFPLLFPENWMINIAFFTLMYAALGVTWNIFGGYAGYPWLGSVVFFGIGAYSLAIYFKDDVLTSGWSPFIYVLPIGLFAGLCAIPIGLIVLRVRGATFAVVSLSLLFVARVLALNLEDITNGVKGLPLPFAPFDVGTYLNPFYYVMLGILALGMLTSLIIARSRFGLMLFSIRDDEDKARGLGIPTTAAKLAAFVITAAFAAMIGSVWAYYINWIYPQFAINPTTMFATVLMVFLGGRGTRWGPIVGAFLVTPVQLYMAYRLGGSQLYLVGYSMLFLVVMLVLPRGIVPTLRDRLQVKRRTTSTHDHAVEMGAMDAT